MNALEDLAAEALTWYAAELRTQAEFCAYIFDVDGRQERLDKAAMIDQMLAARPTEPQADAFDQLLDKAPIATEPAPAKMPVGFTSQRVGLPRKSWDVV